MFKRDRYRWDSEFSMDSEYGHWIIYIYKNGDLVATKLCLSKNSRAAEARKLIKALRRQNVSKVNIQD